MFVQTSYEYKRFTTLPRYTNTFNMDTYCVRHADEKRQDRLYIHWPKLKRGKKYGLDWSRAPPIQLWKEYVMCDLCTRLCIVPTTNDPSLA